MRESEKFEFSEGETILSLHSNNESSNMKMKSHRTGKWSCILSVLLGGCLSSSLNAQTIQDTLQNTNQGKVDTATAHQLPETIVTATRTSRNKEAIGRSVTVITAEDIKNSGLNSIGEVLSMAEGVYVSGSQLVFGSNQSLFIRGANSNQSVVLIDGIPVNDPTSPGGALDVSELSLSDIEQIEIVRGSHSTLYGSSAIGGVVNIITHKKMKQGLNVLASGTAGTFGDGTSLIAQNLGLNYTDKAGFYSTLDFSTGDVAGLDATVDTSTINGMPRDKDGMSRFDYGGKLGFSNGKWNIFISRTSDNQSTDIDGGAFKDDDNSVLDFNRESMSYGVKCDVDSGFSISLNGGKSILARNLVNDSSLTDNSGNYDHSYYRSSDTGVAFTNELQLRFNRKNMDLVLGGGSNDQTMNQRVYSYYGGYVYENDLDSLDLASRTNSFFLLIDLKGSLFGEKYKGLDISLGGRSNKNNNFGSSFTYQFNPSYKLNDHTRIYFNIATGYNAPSLYQMYSPDKDFNSLISRGNINLMPEESITREFGINQEFSRHSGMHLGYFQTDVRNVIEYVYLWNKNTPISQLSFMDYYGDTYLNLGSMRTEGIEIEAHGTLLNKLEIAGAYTYLHGKERFSYEDIDTVKTQGHHVQAFSNGGFVSEKDVHDNGLIRRPSSAMISLTYRPKKGCFAKLSMRQVGQRKDIQGDYSMAYQVKTLPEQSYFLLDLSGGMQFSNNLKGLLRMENLLNTSYSEIRGYTTRGRGVYLTLNYTY